MATTIKKQLGTATRFVFKFDQPPTMTELRKAINDIDVAERDIRLTKVDGNTSTAQNPVRFVFVAEGESETDVPVT